MDNASSCQAACRILQEDYPHITITRCTAHSLDLLLEDICKLSWVDPFLKEGKSLVHYVTNHQTPLAVFRCVVTTLLGNNIYCCF